jgi:DNA-binding transcriptional LysR family regulator
MNIHHLELFYYVARHGGITEAVRNIPYGIQQPAVSGQVAQLEEFLGVTLFQRRPFSLTPAGEKLYGFIHPFFSNLDSITSELQGGKARHIRIGASTIFLRDHLPELFKNVRKKFPKLTISLREGYQAELEALLHKEELDLAVTLIEKKSAPGIHSVALLELPLVLLVAKNSPVTSAEELWQRDKIDEPLICLPNAEAICKNFQQGLANLGVDWFPSLEVSSIDLIETYVTNNFGVGLSVLVPGAKMPPSLRALSLTGFAPAIMGALWHGKPSAVQQAFLDEFRSRAKRLG